jgi:ketosteroid isomerase-like protein
VNADVPRPAAWEAAGLDDLPDRLDRANAHMLDGDCGPWKELLSHREDVSVLGAYGGHVRGWQGVSARFERTASGYVGHAQTSRENIVAWVADDLACTVDIETHRSRVAGQPEPVTFRYRTTHVLRREDGAWRVVLRHADPLATFVGPDFAHGDAQRATPRPPFPTGEPQ